MKKKVLGFASVIAIVVLLFSFQIASAHTTIQVGKYNVEVGWVDEPPIVGQRNAIVVNVEDPASSDTVVDVSKLVVTVSYGGQTKQLTLQPLSEDTTNQYIAPILPTTPGTYTVLLTGKVGDADANASVEPEEVEAADTLTFPNVAASQSNGLGLSGWIAIAALIVGLAGLVLGFMAFQKKS